MERNFRFRRSSHWLVLIALLGPLALVAAFSPNVKQLRASASYDKKPPRIITGSPQNVQSFTNPLVIPLVLTDTNITLVAQPANVQILGGAATQMWTYNGMFPGPTIRRTTELCYVPFNHIPGRAIQS